ncbi:hypothetical protein Tco_1245830 [Tanacetum coccineum]
MAAVEVPQTLEYRGGQLNAAPIPEDFQDSPDDEEDTRSSQEYMNDLEEEYQARALLVEEEVSSDDNEVTKVKALMALADEERDSVGKEIARNSEWIKISMKKIHTLLVMEDNDDRKSFLDYLEQIPTQKKKILGINQLTEDTFSSRPKYLIFIKSSADNVSITDSNKPRLFEAENSTISNHDTGKIPVVKSQRNITDPSVAVTESSVTNYDSADESLVCSTPLPPLKKLDGVEPISGPKTIKSILKSKSTFKTETLNGIIINKPSSAPARGNKSSSASKINSAPACKLKNVKMEDDPPLAIVMKELKEESNLETLNMSQRTVKHVVAMFIPHQIIMTLSGSGKEKFFKLKKAESFKARPEGMYANNSTYTTEGYDYGIVFKKGGKVNVPQHEH